MAESDFKKLARIARVGFVFTPGAPIDDLRFFSGRFDAVVKLVEVVGQKGQHGIVFGDRGVGKTSIANVLHGAFERVANERIRSFRAACASDDNYNMLWQKMFRRMGDQTKEHELSQDRVLEILESQETPTILVFDEVDRLGGADDRRLLADTIKAVSDTVPLITMILVGVGDTVTGLIGDHRSIERNLVQVKIDRMKPDELCKLIDNGIERLEMKIVSAARDRIADRSEGLPHYAHALSKEACCIALSDDRDEVALTDVDRAINKVADSAEASFRSSYENAIRSPRPNALHAQVLLACALAKKDERGRFNPYRVKAPLARLLHAEVKVSTFNGHLAAFITDERGPILRREGVRRKYTYFFDNPGLQPYVILRSIRDNLVTQGLIEDIRAEIRSDAKAVESIELDESAWLNFDPPEAGASA